MVAILRLDSREGKCQPLWNLERGTGRDLHRGVVSEVVKYCKAPNVYVVTRTDASAKAVENRSVLIVACL